MTPIPTPTVRPGAAVLAVLGLTAWLAACNVGYEPVLPSEPSDLASDAGDAGELEGGLAQACPGGCDERQTCCDGLCVSLNSDDAHCGACGNVCVQGAQCVGGVCRCALFAPQCAAPVGDRCDDSECRCGSSSACDSDKVCTRDGCKGP